MDVAKSPRTGDVRATLAAFRERGRNSPRKSMMSQTGREKSPEQAESSRSPDSSLVVPAQLGGWQQPLRRSPPRDYRSHTIEPVAAGDSSRGYSTAHLQHKKLFSPLEVVCCSLNALGPRWWR